MCQMGSYRLLQGWWSGQGTWCVVIRDLGLLTQRNGLNRFGECAVLGSD